MLTGKQLKEKKERSKINNQLNILKFMLKTKLQPLGSRLIVQPIEINETTKSGIILPDTADKEKPVRGKVIAIGKGKILENGQREIIDIKVGDEILFEKYGTDEYKIDKEEFLVVDYEKVVALIK